MKMKRFRKLGFVLVILIAGIFLTGCNCCPTCSSPVGQNCSLTISTGDYIWEDALKNVWGTVYINGQSTGQYIDYQSNPLVIISSVPCNQWVDVYIVDSDSCDLCLYSSQSHTESIYISPGENFLYFGYWKNGNKQNDSHQRCSAS